MTQVVLAGMSTSVGVESTGRSAYDLGYNVALWWTMTDEMPKLTVTASTGYFHDSLKPPPQSKYWR